MIHRLEVDSILLEFGSKRVLQDVFFHCETGKVIGLLGRNGAGKSCLLNIIYGELQLVNKSVRLDGEALYRNYRDPYDFRYLPQFSFVPKGIRLRRLFRNFELDFGRFVEYFPEFNKYYRSRLRKLSGGEQRIVEVYLIVASKTKFCLLDEPFSQVMPLHVETLKKIIRDESRHKGIVVTDHLYKHVTSVCDDLYVIMNGKTYLTRDIDDLKSLGYVN